MRTARGLGAALALALALAACAATPTPAQIVGTEESLMDGLVAAEVGYLQSANPDPTIKADLQKARLAADRVLAPVSAKLQTGQPIGSADALAVQQAVGAFQAAIAAAGIPVPAATSSLSNGGIKS